MHELGEYTANLEKVVQLKYTFSQKQSHLHISSFQFPLPTIVDLCEHCGLNTAVKCLRMRGAQADRANFPNKTFGVLNRRV